MKNLMIDLDGMIVSLRLSWVKRIFSDYGGTWKSYLIHNLDLFGGLFPFNCNYDIHDYPPFPDFYHEPLGWWTRSLPFD